MNDYTYSGTDFEPDKRARDRRAGFDTDDAATSRGNDNNNRRKRKNPNLSSRDEAESGLPRFISRPIDFFTSRKVRSVAGIALILLAAYLSVAALSFLKHSGADQSEILNQTIEQMSQSPESVENIAGPVGAKASHHLFVEGLGLGSVVLIVYMVILGLGLLGMKKINFWSLTFKSLIFAITISFVLGLLTVNSSADIPPGGYHGRYINILLISRSILYKSKSPRD
ncbi:MAG: DNA translocase FtsK 4TM domain-containing protein, partial [Muribaculaceae bacterium]|nr:DNA translocase FtsK 4TM domain-containing protein [Muribaculaceae bacterium]